MSRSTLLPVQVQVRAWIRLLRQDLHVTQREDDRAVNSLDLHRHLTG